jgi:hypothetical protein
MSLQLINDPLGKSQKGAAPRVCISGRHSSHLCGKYVRVCAQEEDFSSIFSIGARRFVVPWRYYVCTSPDCVNSAESCQIFPSAVLLQIMAGVCCARRKGPHLPADTTETRASGLCRQPAWLRLAARCIPTEEIKGGASELVFRRCY